MSAQASPKTAVVFDFGAVLFQWRPLDLLRECVPELAPNESSARELAAQLFQSFNPHSDWAQFDLGLIEEGPLAERIAQRLEVQPAQVRRVIDAIPAHLVAQGPVVELLRALQGAGHRSFYLSNMPKPYATHLEQANSFIAGFEGGIFSGRVNLIKPHAPIFQLAQERFALNPAQTLFIDDHAGNVAAAQQQGWQALQFSSAAQLEQDLKAQRWL